MVLEVVNGFETAMSSAAQTTDRIQTTGAGPNAEYASQGVGGGGGHSADLFCGAFVTRSDRSQDFLAKAPQITFLQPFFSFLSHTLRIFLHLSAVGGMDTPSQTRPD